MIRELKDEIATRLRAYYDSCEAEQIARLLLQEVTQTPYLTLVVNAERGDLPSLSSAERSCLEEWVARLLECEPLQYVLGYAAFFGRKLSVTPDVLIPRPETEYLLDRIARESSLGDVRRCVDIGTGSGAIAITLAGIFSHAVVDALDVSLGALMLADRNVKTHDLSERVRLHRYDLLSPPSDFAFAPYDLIVSNPPYVLPSEMSQMLPHVKDREPHLALFVPQEDPLCYYRAILQQFAPHLKEGGHIFFETNPLTIEQLADESRSFGWIPSVWKDQYDRKRYLHLKHIT